VGRSIIRKCIRARYSPINPREKSYGDCPTGLVVAGAEEDPRLFVANAGEGKIRVLNLGESLKDVQFEESSLRLEDTASTPKPDGDDNGNGPVRLSEEELGSRVEAGRRTLVNPGGGEDSSVSSTNPAMMDPFNRVKAKRDSQGYPEQGGDGRAFGRSGLPTGNPGDGLVQPVDPDGTNPSPTLSSSPV